MKNTLALSAATIALLRGLGLYAPPAQAAYVVTLTQVPDASQPSGFDVVANGSGALDLTGLSSTGPGAPGPVEIHPHAGLIVTGFSADVSSYVGFMGPASFGSGGETFASVWTGDFVAIDSFDNALVVPLNYSGGGLSNTATYDNATFASLGVTPGVYTWTWGASPLAPPVDSFTLKVGVVPEPSTWTMMALGFGLLGVAGYWKRRSVAVAG